VSGDILQQHTSEERFELPGNCFYQLASVVPSNVSLTKKTQTFARLLSEEALHNGGKTTSRENM
jgi:hypothetical protein